MVSFLPGLALMKTTVLKSMRTLSYFRLDTLMTTKLIIQIPNYNIYQPPHNSIKLQRASTCRHLFSRCVYHFNIHLLLDHQILHADDAQLTALQITRYLASRQASGLCICLLIIIPRARMQLVLSVCLFVCLSVW